jgi:sacsin
VWNNQRLLPDVILANPNKLVSLDFDADMFLDKGFNIEKLNSVSMASLIEEIFPKQAFIEATEAERQFISQFWDNFLLLELNKEDILDFPLVPTLAPGRFISLNSCKHGNIPIIPISIDESVCRCLSFFGMSLVRNSTPHCHPSLAHILEENRTDFPAFKFRHILRSLKGLDRTFLLARFQDPDVVENRAHFSEWARRTLFQDVPSNLRDIACALPVWISRNTNNYVSAEQLVVLPQGLDEAVVAPYITRRHITSIPADQSQILRAALENLGVPRVSYPHLFAIIREHLPTVMPDPAERERYKGLLESILAHFPGGGDGLEELRLPNASNFTLMPVRELFSKAERLFVSALQANDPNFASPEFQELEPRLPLKKLEDIDMGIFAHCVQSIAHRTGEEGRNSGGVALDILNGPLPLILSLSGPDAHQWDLINGVNFIPKPTEPLWRPGIGTEDDLGDVRLNVSQYVQRQFGELVSPQDILREEYVGVAWSQRSLSVVPLSERLVRAFPAIGRPSVDDVVSMQ